MLDNQFLFDDYGFSPRGVDEIINEIIFVKEFERLVSSDLVA